MSTLNYGAPQNEPTAYAEYLPFINVQDGLGRLMNNKKLYFTLLGNFKSSKMADELIQSIEEANLSEITQKAHALKGAAANLGLTELMKVTAEIEGEVKAGNGPSISAAVLEDTVNATLNAINTLFELGA